MIDNNHTDFMLKTPNPIPPIPFHAWLSLLWNCMGKKEETMEWNWLVKFVYKLKLETTAFIY